MRRVVAALLMVLFVAWPTGAAAAIPVSAGASDDVIDSMRLTYTVSSDGVLHVREQIVYRFGSSSGRHGIYRDLVTREKYVDDTSKDQLYDVSNIRVSSPSGASAAFTQETYKSNGDRDQTIRLKIGSADRIVTEPTATYVIEYDVRGSLRHFDDHSELYWDATGHGWDARIEQATVRVTVPGGVTQATCFAGDIGSTAPCGSSSVSGGVASFSESVIPSGEGLTIVAGIGAGQVSNDTPILADPPNALERLGLSPVAALLSGLVTIGLLILGIGYGVRGNKDDRYDGVPPGAFPPSGAAVPVVKNRYDDDQIPVAFAPPRISVGEGGLLVDSKANTRETAATLIDLAVKRAVLIENSGTVQRAVLLEPMQAKEPHEQVLVRALFPTLEPGQSVALARRPTGDTSMRKAHDAMIKALRERIRQQNWYVRMPTKLRGPSLGTGVFLGCWSAIFFIPGAVFASVFLASVLGGRGPALAVEIPAVAGIVALVIYLAKRARGRRTALGRAITDQVVGFKKYLATAEADQLRFEEGEDIFSKYLPWAIVFGLADRWQHVCAQLVAAGRIPADPYWYSGPSYYASGYSVAALSDTVASTFDPPPPPAGSGGGGGSSSGFSGGSSGGGGGGGGGGSW